MPTLNDLHLAMGEFLTESSQVENMMLALVMVCRDDRPRDDVFVGFMEKTFGDKIKIFKARCRTRNFTDAHRKILDDVEVELAGLLLSEISSYMGPRINWERTAYRHSLTGSG